MVESFAIITLAANEFMAALHSEKQRMPAILHMKEVETWLSGKPEQARAALIQFPGDQLHAYRVSARVNSPKSDDEKLMEAI